MAAIAGAAAGTLYAGTAQAATSVNCSVPLGSDSCVTATIPASSAHTISYYVEGGFFCAQADFQIKDAANGVVVRSGHVGSGTTGGTVNGLYGSYYMRVFWSCGGAYGAIHN